MDTILILNGANLNLLSVRQPHIYGTQRFEDYLLTLRQRFLNCTIVYEQSNHEGTLIDILHTTHAQGVILNPGGYTHTSVALLDAILAIKQPVVEVHVSNIYTRESMRQRSLTAGGCVGSIVGLGLDGYRLAIDFLLHYRPANNAEM